VNDWHARAACRGRDVRLWFPRPGDVFAVTVAKAVCRACPVRAECLADALARPPFDVVGIWGGTTERDRERLTRQRTPTGRRPIRLSRDRERDNA
jgi:WhiB family redox-sensing transcriptional regulator